MISGADGSGHAHLVLSGPAPSSGWCAQVPGGADGSVSNGVSKGRAQSAGGRRHGGARSAVPRPRGHPHAPDTGSGGCHDAPTKSPRVDPEAACRPGVGGQQFSCLVDTTICSTCLCSSGTTPRSLSAPGSCGGESRRTTRRTSLRLQLAVPLGHARPAPGPGGADVVPGRRVRARPSPGHRSWPLRFGADRPPGLAIQHRLCD